MGRNECAWLLFQDDRGIISLPGEAKRELQLLVTRNSPGGRSVQFTSFEALPVVANPVTAAMS